MDLKGIVEDFIYQNDTNSYTIATFNIDLADAESSGKYFADEQITIVGYLPFVAPGDSLKIIGSIVTHKDYGEQFKVDSFEKLMPEGTVALEKYLSSGTIKGIGPATARKIIERFGEETIHIFKFEPQKLALVKGISETKAIEMGEEFNQKWNLWQIVGFLEKFGIGANNAQKIYDALGADATKKIDENPYILIDIVYGVDFKKIDEYAINYGISRDSESRIKSGIKYSLLVASINGHTCVQKESLLVYAESLLEVDRSTLENCLINLNVQKEIFIESREDEIGINKTSNNIEDSYDETIDGEERINNEWVYLYPFYKGEQNISERLLRLQNFKNIKYIKNFKSEIKKAEKNLSIHLSEMQRDAIEQINDNNVCIITGGPGTGKTTIIKCLIDIYRSKGRKVVLAAPTGRAAKRMTETTGEEAKTIHRLLEIGKIDDDKLSNIDAEIDAIDCDVLVIDEMSMVDIFLMNYIAKALFLGSKLVLVGDSNQLPSVGPGSILKDLIESNQIPFISLNEIFRQAAKSKIIVNAHRVNNGESFIGCNNYEDDSLSDFFYVNEYNQDRTVKLVTSLCTDRLKNYGDYDFFTNIQVLTPTKKGKLGTKELNKILQESLNPFTPEISEKQYGNVVFREGDRVMQVKNNYDIYWERGSNRQVNKYFESKDLGVMPRNAIIPYESGTGIFNGEIGRVSYINFAEKQLEVDFDDGKTAWYAFTELDQLEHSYCITIHKAQGSEFDVVILVIPPASNMLLTRNLLYTGITRAKKLLVVIGNNNLVDKMIHNTETKKRNTGLKYKLKNLAN